MSAFRTPADKRAKNSPGSHHNSVQGTFKCDCDRPIALFSPTSKHRPMPRHRIRRPALIVTRKSKVYLYKQMYVYLINGITFDRLVYDQWHSVFLYIKLCYLIASYITKHYTLWQQYADNWICNCYIRWFSIFSQTAQWWRHDPLYSEDDLRPTSGILLCFPSPSYWWLPLPDFKDMYVKWKATAMTLSDASCSVLCSTVQALFRAYCVYGENVRNFNYVSVYV